MKSNELRIGNWIKSDPYGSEMEWIIYPEDMSKICIADDDSIYKPIPLTEEWLLKFGFYQEKDDDYILDFSDKYAFYVSQYNSLFKFYLDTDTCVIELFHIKHVHQLQNLYFALTNEELTIK